MKAISKEDITFFSANMPSKIPGNALTPANTLSRIQNNLLAGANTLSKNSGSLFVGANTLSKISDNTFADAWIFFSLGMPSEGLQALIFFKFRGPLRSFLNQSSTSARTCCL